MGLAGLAPGKPVTMKVTKPTGESLTVTLNHTFNEEQLEWFKAGSALNFMKKKLAAAAK